MRQLRFTGHIFSVIRPKDIVQFTSEMVFSSNLLIKNGSHTGPLETKQYLSIKYSERLSEAGVDLSVGGTGDTYDNTLVETIH